jgi:hypothetical protein
MPADSLDELRSRLASAATGVTFVSEGEAPFVPVMLAPDASPSAAIGAGEIRRRFSLGDATPVTEHTLDDFFRYGTEPDPADAASQGAVPKVRALRDALRAAAPDAGAFRIGTGPEVRYLVVGHARTGHPATDGAIVGVETIGYES